MKDKKIDKYLVVLIVILLISGGGALYRQISKDRAEAAASAGDSAASDGESVVSAGDSAASDGGSSLDSAGGAGNTSDGTEDTSGGVSGSETPESRSAAPDFTAIDSDNNLVRLADKVGKPVVLNFWATWCPPCVAELPYFNEAYLEYGDDVEFMMVNLTDGVQETVETASEFIEDNGYVFPLYFDTDGDGVQAYGIYVIPVTVLVRPDGTVYASQVGGVDRDSLFKAIDSMLAEE